MGKDTIGECETIIDAAGKIVRGLTEGLNEGKTILSLQGSARSGKTFNILIFLISYITKYNNTRLSIVRKTLPALKGSVLIDFKEIMFRMNLWNDKCLIKQNSFTSFITVHGLSFFQPTTSRKSGAVNEVFSLPMKQMNSVTLNGSNY